MLNSCDVTYRYFRRLKVIKWGSVYILSNILMTNNFWPKWRWVSNQDSNCYEKEEAAWNRQKKEKSLLWQISMTDQLDQWSSEVCSWACISIDKSKQYAYLHKAVKRKPRLLFSISIKCIIRLSNHFRKHRGKLRCLAAGQTWMRCSDVTLRSENYTSSYA